MTGVSSSSSSGYGCEEFGLDPLTVTPAPEANYMTSESDSDDVESVHVVNGVDADGVSAMQAEGAVPDIRVREQRFTLPRQHAVYPMMSTVGVGDRTGMQTLTREAITRTMSRSVHGIFHGGVSIVIDEPGGVRNDVIGSITAVDVDGNPLSVPGVDVTCERVSLPSNRQRVTLTTRQCDVSTPTAPPPREDKIVNVDASTQIDGNEYKFCKYHSWTFNFDPQRYCGDDMNVDGNVNNTANGDASVRDVNKADHIRWLTIVDSKTTINGYFGDCKLHATAGADVVFNECEVYSPGFNVVETPIEVFAGAKAKFIDCTFHDVPVSYDGTRTNRTDGEHQHSVAVIVRDRAVVNFVRCTFEVDDVGVLVMNNAVASFTECTFKQRSGLTTKFNRYCVYVYRESVVNVLQCRFNEFKGRHIFAFDSSTVNVKDMVSDKALGAITVSNESVANVEHLSVYDSVQSGIRVVKKSKLFILDCVIDGSQGNGVQLDNSTGILRDISVNYTKYPAIYISGALSNPIIEQCLITNALSFAIGIRHCARPVFNHITIRNCLSYSVKANTFANFEMYHVSFEEAARPMVLLAGKSNMFIDDYYVDGSTLINVAADSMFMSGRYDEDIYFMVRKCATVDQRAITPRVGGQSMTTRNGVHTVVWRKSPKVNSCTNVNEDYLLQRVGVSQLITLDVAKVSTFTADDETLATRDDVLRDPQLPVMTRSRSIERTKMVFNRSSSMEYHCIFCSALIDIAEDKVKVVLPCGHLCCNHCYNHNENYFDGRCPTCKTLITEVRDLYVSDRVCCVCVDAQVCVVFVPCCHACICYACGTECAMRGKCPMCNCSTSGYLMLE